MQAVFNRRELHAQAGKNPELRVLYYRLARLLMLPVTAIFVFDGPKRPAVKRGKKVRAKPHWLTNGFRELVAAFGFHSHLVTTPFSCFAPSLLMLV
jgi:holliday junction resolvase YEN1